MSNREIARRRGVSLDAVKFHVSNALGKLGLANRAALRRWFRVPAGSALDRRDRSMTTTTLGPLAQISRTVRDIKESETFYGTVLGLAHLSSFGSVAFFDCGGTRLYLTAQEKPGPESILYLRVADIRTAYEELRSRGVQFSQPPHMIHRHADGTEEWLAHFNDPEGRPLAIMSQVKP